MRSWALVAMVVAATPAAAQTNETVPALTITRYDEDWSTRPAAQAAIPSAIAGLKHISLGDSAYLNTGIEVRLRDEDYRSASWGGGPAPNDGYLWTRVMPYADLHIGQLRVFAQPILAYAVGVAPKAGPIDQTSVDLLQGFADVAVPIGDTAKLTLRAGREMLSLGTERLIGTRYGPNVPLAFDGVRALFKRGALAVTLLDVRPVQPGLAAFDDKASSTKQLWGAYATLGGFDLYYLGYRNRAARFADSAGDEHRSSVGIRSFGTAGDWHWNVEGIAQFGHLSNQRIRAWSLSSEVGRHFPKAPFAPDATLRFNIVSGDTKRGDGTLGTFNALFPKGKYFGELSPVGPYNILNVNPAIAFDLGQSVSAGVMAQFYWRYSRADGVYDVPGNLIRDAGTARSRFIGKQIEASLGWQASYALALSASLSAFDAGSFLRETGPAHTIAMLGLEANYRF